MERHTMRVAGLGFRAAATQADLAQAVQAALAATGGARLDALATIPRKASAPALRALAAAMGLPVHAVEVAGQDTPTRSARLLAGFATGSVAEAAALAAVGLGARLIVPRVMAANGMATAAIAETSSLGKGTAQ
jgi:cobalt-precorrin 5A hydrolase